MRNYRKDPRGRHSTILPVSALYFNPNLWNACNILKYVSSESQSPNVNVICWFLVDLQNEPLHFQVPSAFSRMKLDQLKNGTYVKLRPLWVRASNLTYTMVSGWRVTASPIALCRSTQPLKVNFNIKKEPQSFIPKVCPHLSSHSSSHKTVSFEDGSSQHPPFFWFAMPLGCKISG